MLMQFRDGKTSSVREYLDTQHANDVWVVPITEQESQRLRDTTQSDA